MKAPPFDFVRPSSLAEALTILHANPHAKILAGGQSLVASLNMRLSSPSLIVDINDAKELEGIERMDCTVRIGALVRHRDVAESPTIAADVPLVAMAMKYVAHPAIRNRGTTCGSLAYADPAAEIPACAVLLDAVLVLASSNGRREVAARDFFLGLYETLCGPDEILIEARFPKRRLNECFGFAEAVTRHGDFAAVGVAARALVQSGRVEDLEIVVFASEAKPLLCSGLKTSWHLAEGSGAHAQIADTVARQMEPIAKTESAVSVKRRQAHALVGRVLDDLTRQTLR